MSRLRSLLTSALRWGWFGLLVMFAFGYLVAGLSDPANDASSDSTDGFPKIETSSETVEALQPGIDTDLQQLHQTWQAALDDAGVQAAPIADWMTVCRRISLALVGSGMSIEEIRQLERLPEPQRERQHLENLLHDSRFHHYWGERWARFLVGTDEGQFIVYRRRRFRIWLTQQFASNVRYDELVERLITAEGLWTDKPEVNFLTSTFDSNDNSPDPIRLAARTSRAFLGLRIDCLQCHNDFLGNVNLGDTESPREGLQTDFHQLAAFYTSAKNNGLQGVRNGKADYRYKFLGADEEVDVQPAVPYSPELLPEHGDARQRLAAWVTDPENRQAARAGVSHVWALMFGRAADESVDNLPLDEPSHPMIEWLTDDFIANDFDIRRLIRLIAGSPAFRVDSRGPIEITESMEDVGAAFPLVRLRPEQVAGAITQASRIKKTDRDSSLLLQLMTYSEANEFVTRYGDIGEDEFSTDSVTISQRLLMMNGKMTRELTKENPILNASSHIRMFAQDDTAAVEAIYLSVLNRYPTPDEANHFVERLANTESRTRAIEDMMWVLLNSSELAWNH